jgi:ABC-type nitrate/sulfonate/bicarbonate transport system permease component
MNARSAGRLANLELWALGIGGLAVFFGLWAALSGFGLVPPRFLPSPAAVAQRMFFLIDHPFAGATLPLHVVSSLGRYALGFLLAAAIGVPLGLCMGWYGLLDDIVSPIFNALRFIAPIAWVPFAALWFGTGIGGPIMVIFAGAFPPCLINAYRGGYDGHHERRVESQCTLCAPRQICRAVERSCKNEGRQDPHHHQLDSGLRGAGLSEEMGPQ